MIKILTNIRFYNVAGIAQYLLELVDHNEKNPMAHLYGVNIIRPDEIQDALPKKKFKHFTFVKKVINYPQINQVLKISKGNFSYFPQIYKQIIDTYDNIIKCVKPDLILINGSYFLPWCLLQAAQKYKKIPVCMHYHGILKKEVEHWPNIKYKQAMLQMERDFDNANIFYIFPSHLSKNVVEKKVFCHRIKKSAIIPNPAAKTFFEYSHFKKNVIRKIGIVGRWDKIKNMEFVIKLAKYNSRRKQPFEINVVTNKHAPLKKMKYKNLHFQKPMKKNRLAEFYTRQGILISPSYFETYGNIPQEALASGTPALVNAQMGVAETFKKIGLSCWVIEFKSPSQVWHIIERTVKKEIPQKAKQILIQKYSSHKIFSNYLKLLASKIMYREM